MPELTPTAWFLIGVFITLCIIALIEKIQKNQEQNDITKVNPEKMKADHWNSLPGEKTHVCDKVRSCMDNETITREWQCWHWLPHAPFGDETSGCRITQPCPHHAEEFNCTCVSIDSLIKK